MPICVCQKMKDMGPFRLQMIEMNEKKSLKMGVKFAVPFYMGKNAKTELQILGR